MFVTHKFLELLNLSLFQFLSEHQYPESENAANIFSVSEVLFMCLKNFDRGLVFKKLALSFSFDWDFFSEHFIIQIRQLHNWN